MGSLVSCSASTRLTSRESVNHDLRSDFCLQCLPSNCKLAQSTSTPRLPLSLVSQSYARFIQMIEPLPLASGSVGIDDPAAKPVFPVLLSFEQVIARQDAVREDAMRHWTQRLDVEGSSKDSSTLGKLIFVNGKASVRDDVGFSALSYKSFHSFRVFFCCI